MAMVMGWRWDGDGDGMAMVMGWQWDGDGVHLAIYGQLRAAWLTKRLLWSNLAAICNAALKIPTPQLYKPGLLALRSLAVPPPGPTLARPPGRPALRPALRSSSGPSPA